MYKVFRTNVFEKEIKTIQKRNKNFTKLKLIIEKLASYIKLDPKQKDHKLLGNWNGCRECHIEPDCLLIYRINNDILELIRTGTHVQTYFNFIKLIKT